MLGHVRTVFSLHRSASPMERTVQTEALLGRENTCPGQTDQKKNVNWPGRPDAYKLEPTGLYLDSSFYLLVVQTSGSRL